MPAGNRDAIIASLIGALNADNPDSLEIGTAAKGGGVKVYGNFNKPEEFKVKLDSALELRLHARAKIAEGDAP